MPDGRLRPVVLAWLLLTAITQAPYLRAAVSLPPDGAFAGCFFYFDDFYNYLSFTQQAEDGAFLFRNKLKLEPHAGAMINLEWWFVGRVSAVLGGRPLLAWRVLAALASLLFLLAIDHWLRRCHLPDPHRLPALLLIAFGGGVGGLATRLELTPMWERNGAPGAVDLVTGLSPFIGFLANPHFVVGTALLLWTMAAFAERRVVFFLLLANVLALTRPYDFVLVVALCGAGLLLTEPWRDWPRRLAPLGALLPVVAYCGWLYYRCPAFAFYAQARYPFPSLRSFMLGLGPAVLLALPSVRWRPERRYSTYLMAWAGAAVAVIAAHPVGFSLQFLVGVGAPLLALAALALAHRPPAVLLAVAIVMSTTAWEATRLVLQPWWLVPKAEMDVVRGLRPHCRPGDVAFLPAGRLGLLAGGLTACQAYTSHGIEPDHGRRLAEVRQFYATASPDQRARLLDATCARFVLAPVDAEPFLGRPVVRTVSAAALLAIHEWRQPPDCVSGAHAR
jgi:hypothetical protein